VVEREDILEILAFVVSVSVNWLQMEKYRVSQGQAGSRKKLIYQEIKNEYK
jgi:hypothetical protein